MNNILIRLLLVIIMTGCSIRQNQDNNKNITLKRNELSSVTPELPIKSKELNEELDKIIYQEDSLSNSDTLHNESKSFCIGFRSQNNDCIVKLISNLDYYYSKPMIGYFRYKNKIISIYSDSSSCIQNMIDLERLSTGKIEELTDTYNMIILEYEALERTFRIEKNGRLVLISERQ